MSSAIVVSHCQCGRWLDTRGDDRECDCGKFVFEAGNVFGDISPECKATETFLIDLNKVMPVLKELGIERFLM